MLESIAVKLAKPATTILVEGMFANIAVNTAVTGQHADERGCCRESDHGRIIIFILLFRIWNT